MKNRKVIIVLALLLVGVLFFLYSRGRFNEQRAKQNQKKVEDKAVIPEDSSLKRRQTESTERNEVNPTVDLIELELPQCDERKIVRHAGFTFEYDESNEQAKWVAYQLTASETVRRFKRSDNFRIDPKISSGSATDDDYRRSGYDRGHLAPAADMAWSSQTMSESFYYSNMSPQVPGFNRGIWKRLEEQLRNWAVELDTIYVVTGPILSGNMNYIGPDNVAVPNYYYKAVLYSRGSESRAIGFVMANLASQENVFNYSVSIDSVEKLTGLDLFAALPDHLENSIERNLCVSCWNWNSVNRKDSRVKEKVREQESVQCSGITRSGRRCKRLTLNPNGRCYQHQ